MREFSDQRRTSRRPRELRSIIAFQLHLEREGVDFETWERLNPGPDLDSEALALARRRTAQNGRARA